MVWTTTLPARLRYIIGDITTTQDYTDLQLQYLIAIAAITVASETNIVTTFTIDTDVPSISPDPSTDTSIALGVGNLFVMKAACIIAQSEFRKDTAKFGIKIRDDITAYDGTEAMKARGAAAISFCKLYEDTKWDWELGNRTAGRAILGPYTSFNYNRHADQFALDWSENGAGNRTDGSEIV